MAKTYGRLRFHSSHRPAAGSGARRHSVGSSVGSPVPLPALLSARAELCQGCPRLHRVDPQLTKLCDWPPPDLHEHLRAHRAPTSSRRPGSHPSRWPQGCSTTSTRVATLRPAALKPRSERPPNSPSRPTPDGAVGRAYRLP